MLCIDQTGSVDGRGWFERCTIVAVCTVSGRNRWGVGGSYRPVSLDRCGVVGEMKSVFWHVSTRPSLWIGGVGLYGTPSLLCVPFKVGTGGAAMVRIAQFRWINAVLWGMR